MTLTEPALLAPVVAHRGASADAPENTLAAVRLAAKQGVRCMELDVSISADDVPFVHHDNKLDRCTNGHGLLRDHTAAELDKLSADKGMPEFAGEPLPRLTAVIDLLVELGAGLNLEIKPKPGLETETARAICQIIEAHWPSHLTLVFSCFSKAALHEARLCLPEIPRALLVGAVPENWAEELNALGCRNLHCSEKSVTAAQVDVLRTAGFGVYCFAVNDTANARRLLDMGVHGVFSACPGKLLDELSLNTIT
jgi:glycerophosphoryl diester phosphodiesterase